MALRKSETKETPQVESLSGMKAKTIEPSFKAELEELFTDMGLGWAAGVRFALREFYKKYSDNE